MLTPHLAGVWYRSLNPYGNPDWWWGMPSILFDDFSFGAESWKDLQILGQFQYERSVYNK